MYNPVVFTHPQGLGTVILAEFRNTAVAPSAVAARFPLPRLSATTALPSASGPPAPAVRTHRRIRQPADRPLPSPPPRPVFSRLVRFVARIRAASLFSAKQCSLGWTGRVGASIRRLMDHLRSQFLALTTDPAMNIRAQVFVCFQLSWSEIAGSRAAPCLTRCGCTVLYHYSMCEESGLLFSF